MRTVEEERELSTRDPFCRCGHRMTMQGIYLTQIEAVKLRT